jgi:hypothetical protein
METSYRLLLVLSLAGFVSPCLAEPAVAQTRLYEPAWGATQAKVIEAESEHHASFRESDGEMILEYDSVTVAELGCRLLYFFANDKLVRVKYIFQSAHADLNDFISDFRAVDPYLRNTYGKPAHERTFWENDPFQDEGVNYLEQDRALPLDILPSDKFAGIEVSLGYLKLYSQWTALRTRIVHALSGADHRIIHQVEYRSVELEELENVVRRQTPQH